MSVVLELVAVLLAPAVAVGVALLKRKDPWWSPFAPWLLLTGIAIGSSVALYIWVFEVGETCSGRYDFACQVNANQGLLTLLGLVLAAATLWTTAITRILDRQHSRRVFEVRLRASLQAAIEECHHNLIHVALAYDDDGPLRRIPQLSLSAISTLVRDDLRPEFHPELPLIIERMSRNHTTFTSLVSIGPAELAKRVEDGNEPNSLRGFVCQSLRFLMLAAGFPDSDIGSFFARPGLQDFRRILRSKHFWVYFRTSDPDASAAAPGLRNAEEPILCWWNDEPIPGVEIFPQGPRFRDMARDHQPH